MDAQTRFSSSELKARRTLLTYPLTCYKLTTNTNTQIYRTRTQTDTWCRGREYATRKL